MTNANPREALGGNTGIDHARDVISRLSKDYAALSESVAAVLVDARALPAEVDSVEVAEQFTAVIKRIRELDTRVEGIREAEKEPYLTSERAVDQFFFGLRDRLERRKKTEKPGGADVLVARLHAYNQKRLDEERARRDEELRVAREAEDVARREREELQRQQREAEEKAARARKLENKEAAEAAASEAERAAAAARKAEEDARQKSMLAQAQTQSSSADMVRERHGSGALNTMRQVPLVEIIDSMKLNAVALWPFVKDDQIGRAHV